MTKTISMIPPLLALAGGLLAISSPWTPVIGSIGGGLAVLGGFWAGVQAQRQASADLERRLEHERNLREKSDEIADLNRQIVKTVTGGESYCWISPSNLEGATHTVMFALVHVGDFPLYEVTLEIADMRKFVQPNPEMVSYEQLRRGNFVSSLGTMSVGHGRLMPPWSMPNMDRVSYMASFSGRNGTWWQHLHMLFLEGRWQYATRVYRHDRETNEAELLMERVLDGFPRNASGEVDWDGLP